MAEMNLAASSDINTWVELANNAGAGVINPTTFYSKQLLDTIRIDGSQYVYFRYADPMPIQEKADELQVRRWAPLQGHTIPLDEGIPPKSDKGSVEKYTIAAKQYGRYMEFTDKVSFKVVDPVVAFYTREYNLVAMETLDLLAREALFAIANKWFAGNKVNHEALTLTSVPTMTDLRLICLNFKKNLVKPRSNGRFHVIGSAEFYYDMISDPIVEKYMNYNRTTKTMYDNSQLCPMFDMEFYETLVVPTTADFIKGGKASMVMYRETGAGVTQYVTVQEAATTGSMATVGEVTTYSPDMKLTTVSGYVQDARTGNDASYIPGQKIWDLETWMEQNTPSDGGTAWAPLKVQHIYVLGKDALVRTGLSGEDNAKMYVKPLGSAGVLDPIDQRQSIGFKINSVGFASTRLEAVVDYECVPSQVN